MVDLNTSVDNVSSDTLTSGVVEDVVLLVGLSVGETVKTRGCVDLSNGSVELNTGVGLDVGNLVGLEEILDHHVISIKGHGAPCVHAEGLDGSGHGLADGASLVEVSLLDGGGNRELLGGDGVVIKGVVVDNDVSVRDNVERVRVRKHRSKESADSHLLVELFAKSTTNIATDSFGHVANGLGNIHGGRGGQGSCNEQRGEESLEESHDELNVRFVVKIV